jgi:enoyl-[acyl-carrier protein] reductase I
MTVTESPRPPLRGHNALVVSIANEHSIAYACAKAFHELCAELAITYVKERTREFFGSKAIEERAQ